MRSTTGNYDPRGSVWHRWDPHIHTPGTILNDQYRGENPWDQFCSGVEASNPPIHALGITDYCSVEAYDEVLRLRAANRLPHVDFIFPNVELRLALGTRKGSAINLHLMFNPADPEFRDQVRRFLLNLSFHDGKELYRCTKEDLIRLGKVHDRSITEERAALRAGTNQFKVDFNQLREEWQKSEWVQENCLVAVSGNASDGTSGLRDDDDSFAVLRKTVERFAHFIYSASPQQVAFWLGNGSASPAELEEKWGGPKACLHGSDAHSPDRVGNPDLGRKCWLKGDLNFETLRYAVIDPERRTFIGALPPKHALPSNTIASVLVKNADWMKPNEIALNAGVVAIIGARGSGKTALADFIATGAFGVKEQLSAGSFLRRASDYLAETSVQLRWCSGQPTENAVSAADAEDLFDAPHVQYLSQKFVENLCSSDGLTDALMDEIRRVVFEAHALADREGATDFAQLLDLRLETARHTRRLKEADLARLTQAITVEQVRKDKLPAVIRERDAKKAAIAKLKESRKQTIGAGQEDRVKRLEAITDALAGKQGAVQAQRGRVQALKGLQLDAADYLKRQHSEWLDSVKEERSEAGLSNEDWDRFQVAFTGDVSGLIKERMAAAEKSMHTLLGTHAAPPLDPNADPKVALIPEAADLSAQSVAMLERERARIQKLIGVDETNARRYKQYSDQLALEEQNLAKLETAVVLGSKAGETMNELRDERQQAYRGTFDAILEEERELQKLYAPLKERIDAGQGAVRKLEFSVKRSVNLEDWAQRGEQLLDLRTGPFKGRGELQATVPELAAAWRDGDASAVVKAMGNFLAANQENLKNQMPAGEDYRQWAGRVSQWLFSTEHITVNYGLKYDGVVIESLSPGTRGIVLLLLYLAIDTADERPLIIDQPEENLDPQSVFEELVPVFRQARTRRQIIVVTHNANIVVNADVEQVIVAKCGAHRPGKLPLISYTAGGLENPAIRAEVCAILEGGASAFRERAKRLCLPLTRRETVAS